MLVAPSINPEINVFNFKSIPDFAFLTKEEKVKNPIISKRIPIPIFVGLKLSKGDKIIVMDDDLQHPPSSLITIYNKLNDFDTCYTLYLKRKHIFWKILTSNINNLFSSFIFNKAYKIYLSSSKGFSSEVKNKFFGI